MVTKENVLDVKSTKAYKNEEAYPKTELQKGKIFVDNNHFAVLFPVTDTKWMPVHISLIKTVNI